MPKKNNKKVWLSSTMVVLLIALALFVLIGRWWHGNWTEIFVQALNYGIGATITALIVAIIGIILGRKRIQNIVKQIMR